MFLRGYGGQTSYHYALLATGAPDSVNFRVMGYMKFPPHFDRGRHGIGGDQGALESQEDRGTTGNMGEQETTIGVG